MTYGPDEQDGSSDYDPFRTSGYDPFRRSAAGYEPYAAGWQPRPPQGFRRPDTTVALWSYLGPLLIWGVSFFFMPFLVWFAWVVPLVMRNSQTAKQDPFTRRHATQALNATLTDVIVAVPLLILVIMAFFGGLMSDGGDGSGTAFGVLIAFIILLAGIGYTIARIVFSIIACTKANSGEDYSMPSWIAFPMVKDHQDQQPSSGAPRDGYDPHRLGGK